MEKLPGGGVENATTSTTSGTSSKRVSKFEKIINMTLTEVNKQSMDTFKEVVASFNKCNKDDIATNISDTLSAIDKLKTHKRELEREMNETDNTELIAKKKKNY